MNRHVSAYIRRLGLAALVLTASSSSLQAQQDITSNLRGHWRLTETSGTTAVDSSPTPHNGTYTNGVLLANSTAVPVDGALAANFDGVNDYVAVSTESYFDITGAITVAAWIKVDVWDVQWQAIVTKGDSAWRLVRDSLNNGVTFACTGLSTLRVSTNVAVNDGKWHHIVGQYNSGYLMIYVDGVLNSYVAVTGAIATNNFPVEIGGIAEAAGREFDGAIYDVRVYNRGLSPQDIAYLALQGGPVGAWSFDQASGLTATDSSIFAAAATISPSAAWSTRCNGTGAFDFNGSTHYASVPNAAQLQPTFALSITGWIRGDAWTAADVVNTILRKGDATPNNYALSVADGKVQLLLDAADTAGFRGNTTLVPGQWYHVTATWDGATVRIYVNGVLDNTPAAYSTYLSADTRALFLGGRTGTTDMFDGLIQEVSLYNRALSPAEVARAAGFPGHWKFAEGTGTTAADSTIAANNATLSGGATWSTDCAGNKALVTNGAGGIAQTAAAFDPPKEGTIAFWTAPEAGTTLRRVFGLGGDWEVRQQADSTLVFDICADGGTTLATTLPLDEAGRWYHVAYTYDCDNESYAMYIDGELHRAGTHPSNMVKQAAGVLAFGTRTGATEYWPGALRDFRIYSRKLCASEIGDLAGLAMSWKLDETAGTVAADSSLFGRNGAITGTATWAAGKLGNAIQLNGTNYVSTSAAGLTPRNVTIAAWANLTAADTSGAELISIGDRLAVRLNESGSTRAFFYNGTTWLSITVNQTFAGSGWRHFAAVFDDDNNVFRFYMNGAEVGSLATTASISYTGLGPNIVVGRHGNGNTAYDFTGTIDDARIYTRALCASQIMEIVNDGGGAYQGVRILRWVETR